MIFDWTDIYKVHTVFSPSNTFSTISRSLSDLDKFCYGSQECYTNLEQVAVEDASAQNDTVKCLRDVCYSADLDTDKYQVLLLDGD